MVQLSSKIKYQFDYFYVNRNIQAVSEIMIQIFRDDEEEQKYQFEIGNPGPETPHYQVISQNRFPWLQEVGRQPGQHISIHHEDHIFIHPVCIVFVRDILPDLLQYVPLVCQCI
mgnify:CR=1 FL=1